jgi:hypothetical protein
MPTTAKHQERKNPMIKTTITWTNNNPKGYKRRHRGGFEVRHRRRSESDQKNGGTNLFARRARLANYSPDFKTKEPPAACRQRLKVGDVHAGPPNMLVGLGER